MSESEVRVQNSGEKTQITFTKESIQRTWFYIFGRFQGRFGKDVGKDWKTYIMLSED